MNKLDILVFAAHPDDAELGAGGTIAKEVALGKKVGVVDLTRGELGTRGTPEIRAKEAQKAAEILGLAVRENLGLADGFSTVGQFISQKTHNVPTDIVHYDFMSQQNMLDLVKAVGPLSEAVSKILKFIKN